MKKTFLIVAILAIGVFSSNVNASLLTFNDNPSPDKTITDTNGYSWTYSGLPESQNFTAISMSLILTVKDDTTDPTNSKPDNFYISVSNGSGSWQEIGSFSGQLESYPTDQKYTITNTTLLNYILKGNDIRILAEDRRDLIFDKSQLEITGTAVPVPAAAWLLGTGLIGLVVIRRKKG
jgi:hypothetical protein